jgi:hypothetical protein
LLGRQALFVASKYELFTAKVAWRRTPAATPAATAAVPSVVPGSLVRFGLGGVDAAGLAFGPAPRSAAAEAYDDGRASYAAPAASVVWVAAADGRLSALDPKSATAAAAAAAPFLGATTTYGNSFPNAVAFAQDAGSLFSPPPSSPSAGASVDLLGPTAGFNGLSGIGGFGHGAVGGFALDAARGRAWASRGRTVTAFKADPKFARALDGYFLLKRGSSGSSVGAFKGANGEGTGGAWVPDAELGPEALAALCDRCRAAQAAQAAQNAASKAPGAVSNLRARDFFEVSDLAVSGDSLVLLFGPAAALVVLSLSDGGAKLAEHAAPEPPSSHAELAGPAGGRGGSASGGWSGLALAPLSPKPEPEGAAAAAASDEGDAGFTVILAAKFPPAVRAFAFSLAEGFQCA